MCGRCLPVGTVCRGCRWHCRRTRRLWTWPQWVLKWLRCPLQAIRPPPGEPGSWMPGAGAGQGTPRPPGSHCHRHQCQCFWTQGTCLSIRKCAKAQLHLVLSSRILEVLIRHHFQSQFLSDFRKLTATSGLLNFQVLEGNRTTDEFCQDP